MFSLHPGDATFATSFTRIIYSEDGDKFSAAFKPPKGKKFVVLLVGVADKNAQYFELEQALNRLGFYRRESE
ncbi:TPA: hypothetical protein L9L55_005061 [Klebsiella quasipneumoniae subsp. quasipneumoniae]|nr:hypothetical protein [Klebsiella quasipneumoniae subsp. quasipneumoniae]